MWARIPFTDLFFVAYGFNFIRELMTAVMSITSVLVPIVFTLCSVIGLGTKKWGRCL